MKKERMKERIPVICPYILGEISYDNGQFFAEIIVHRPNLEKYVVEDYVDISTFLLDSHDCINGNFSTFKQFLKDHKNTPCYLRNRMQFNLTKQKEPYASYSFLDSCSCGFPYCNGINNGVRFYRHNDFFIYKVGKRQGYKNGILGSGYKKIKIHESFILKIRKQLKQFMVENGIVLPHSN